MMFSLLMRRCLALLALAAAVPAFAAVDESQLLPIDEAFALTASAPSPDMVELRWVIADGYYLYRHRMSAVPEGSDVTAGELVLPQGIQRTDEFFGEVETYRQSVTATLPITASGDSPTLKLKVRYQGCADVGICYPPHQKIVEVALPVGQAEAASGGLFQADTGAVPLLSGAGAPSLLGGDAPIASTEELPLPAEEAFQFEAIAVSPVELLLRFTPAPGYYLYRDRSEFRLTGTEGATLATPQWPASRPHYDEHFGDVAVYFDQVEVPLPLRRTNSAAGAVTLEATFQGCQTDGICYPPMTRQVRIDLPQATPEQLVSTQMAGESASSGASREGVSLWLALLLALGGGLILNLMPCVLPVLSLKAIGLAQSGESREHARAHALWYTAGVLVSFVALGVAVLLLRQAGLALGWGFQLQQPSVVAVLVYVIAAVGLSLSGVFSIGAGWAGAGQKLTQKSGAAGDFFTGVLAVVVASPCTAPFMGTAMAFAFASGTFAALAVFVALGLGLALPFLLIGFVPSLANALPKPGVWMESLKQVLAFPMYLTAVWLLWVLGRQLGVDAMAHVLAGVAVLALALWCWEKARWQGSMAKRVLAVVLLALALWPVLSLRGAAPQVPAAEDAETAWSQVRMDELRAAGKTVFVNMTADWCVTCKANEKRVLATDAFHAALDAAGAQYLVGDWTNVDPAITAFLEAHGAVGVPLYVVFHGQQEGIVLPTVLTQSAVDSALGSKP
jgi:thiol:disulfide interchange protein